MTALAAGLLVGAVLISPAAAETAPASPAKQAPIGSPIASAPAGSHSTPGNAKTPAAPAETRAETKAAALPNAKPAEAKTEPPKTAASPTPTPHKEADKPKPVDKKVLASAKKAYADATTAYKAGKYDAALAKFQEAESYVPSANAEYWIAASLDKLDRQAEALAAYASLLNNPDLAKAGADKASEAKARFDALRATVPGELVLTAVPADAKASVDGQAQSEKSPWTLKLAPGDHKILVTAEGFLPQEILVGVEAAKRESRTIELAAVPPPAPPPLEPVAAPPPPPPPPPAPTPKSMVPAYVTLGIAGVAAGAGTFFGIRALSAKSDYNKTPTSSKADDVENNALIADMAFGVAITLGVTGIVLLTTPEEQPAAAPASAALKPRRLSLSPWASPKSGGASALLEF